jgi:MFS superfamily sulfate permease-like transporter
MKKQLENGPDNLPSPLISAGDITGSVSNFGTVLPLLVAVSTTSGMSLSLMILLCGIWYILTGIIYHLPISVEPLKAVAAISITGHYCPSVIAASGILTGVLFLVLGFTGSMGWLQNRIPSPVIRGIQLALGTLLLKSAILDFGVHDISFFALCIIIIIIFTGVRLWRDIPDISALLILLAGAAVILYHQGMPPWKLPVLPLLSIPGFSDFVTGLDLFLPQIPLTVANSILATSILASDRYNRQVTPDRLSITVGAMSLSSSVLGGFPLCHGAGGVAAHFRFGARRGSALVIGGLVLICISSLVTDPTALSAIPKGIFGALILAVAIELLKGGLKGDNPLVPVMMAVVAIPAGMASAFVTGLILSLVIPRLKKKRNE